MKPTFNWHIFYVLWISVWILSKFWVAIHCHKSFWLCAVFLQDMEVLLKKTQNYKIFLRKTVNIYAIFEETPNWPFHINWLENVVKSKFVLLRRCHKAPFKNFTQKCIAKHPIYLCKQFFLNWFSNVLAFFLPACEKLDVNIKYDVLGIKWWFFNFAK